MMKHTETNNKSVMVDFFKYFWMFNWLIDYLLLKHPVLNVIHIQEQIYRVLATTVPLVERELPTLPEHLPLPPVFSGVRVARSLVFCMVFCVSLFIILLFLLWPLRCLSFSDLRLLITPLAITLSVLLRFTTSDYPFGHYVVCPSLIYDFWLPLWPLRCLSFSDLRLLITPLAITLSVLLWFTTYDYPFGIFTLFL